MIEAIQEKYKKYITEFCDIPEEFKDRHYDDIDKTPSENLSYQLGWTGLLLKWEENEKNGKEVFTPSKGYKWNNLGGLYQSFYEKYGSLKMEQQIKALNKNVEDICAWINSLTEKELFEPEQRKWATTNAKWPLYKWIHINTVAPFTNFRTKIRKWKKINSSNN